MCQRFVLVPYSHTLWSASLQHCCASFLTIVSIDDRCHNILEVQQSVIQTASLSNNASVRVNSISVMGTVDKD